MLKKKDTSSSHGSGTKIDSNEGHLRQLQPIPDNDKKGKPLDPLLRSGSWRGKAPAVASLAPDNAAIISKDLESRALHNHSASTTSPRLTRTLTSPGKSALSAAVPTRLSVIRNVNGEVAEPVEIKDESDMGKMPVLEPAKDVPTQDRRVSARPWIGWLSNSDPNPSQHKATAVMDDADPGEHNEASTQVGENASISVETIQPEAIALPPDSPAPEAQATDRDARRRSSSWFGLWQGAAENQEHPPEMNVREPSVDVPGPGDTVPDLFQVEGSHEAASDNRESWFGSWKSTKGQPTTSSGTSNASTIISTITRDGDRKHVVNSEEAGNGRVTPAPAATQGYVSWIWARGTPATIATSTVASEVTSDTTDMQADSTSAQDTQNMKTMPGSSILSKLPVISGISAGVWEGMTPAVAVSDSEIASPAPRDTDSTSEDLLSKNNAQTQPNLVLPCLHDTIPKATQAPSYTQQLYSWLNRAPSPHERYAKLNTTKQRIDRVVVIGVHGFFPGAWFQKVFGHPTGTSARFADGAAAAVEAWVAAQGYSCEIEKIALEGEGMVADRLETLWKLLLGWKDQLEKADVVIIACHSQGVPVGVSLMAKLIEEGITKLEVRLGITAMAGISLGPFPSLQSRFLAPVSSVPGELFTFALPESSASISYVSALRICLSRGVRVSYTGSIDDQLVSLESSLFSTISHPYIYRSVFVDSRIHAPSFLTHLVAFAIKVRNLGGSDHGLIRELSLSLAGSLYGGEGHSMIYQEPGVYELGVAWTLESADLGHPAKMELKEGYEAPSGTNANPFFLPWAVRGLLEEEMVKNTLQEEAKHLLTQFDDWQPTTKALKDVKFRLEAVRTKL